jgi:hypothetical protein
MSGDAIAHFLGLEKVVTSWHWIPAANSMQARGNGK